MKNIIKSLAGGFLTFALIYLISCFVAADFNITHWTPAGRFFCGLMGGVTSLTITAVSLSFYEENK
jgi:hypothetical protein